MDQTPQYADSDTPYAIWGFCPRFFDDPSIQRAGIRWVAEAFLATSPDTLMTKTLVPVSVFR